MYVNNYLCPITLIYVSMFKRHPQRVSYICQIYKLIKQK